MKINLSKRQRIFIFVALLVTIAALLVGVLVLSREHAEGQEENGNSIIQTIPEADIEETEKTKTESYRSGRADVYWRSLGKEGDTAAGTSPKEEPEPQSGYPSRHRRPDPVQPDDLFGEYKDAGSGGTPARKRPEERSTSSVETEEAPSGSETPESENPLSEEQPKAPRQVKRSGAISSLDEDVSTDLGNGFSTLDGTERWVSEREGKPYRCMFIRDEKVRSGQRITVRLLEDLVISGVHIPKNTHLQGVCTISDRMEVAISSLDMGGRILTLGFQAYDTDGGKGIYCSELSQVRKDVTEQGIATVTSGLNSRLGRVARDAAAVGASIVRNKSGEATVSVPAGYTFYLMEEQK